MVNYGRSIIRTVLFSNKSVFQSNHPRRMMSTVLLADDLVFQENGKAGVIVYNRPKGLNAMNVVMIHGMTRMLEEYEKFKSLVIIKSAIPKVFSAGGDVVGIYQLSRNKDKTSMYVLRYGYPLLHTIGTLKIPNVALADGITLGGGAGVAMMSKYFVCTENTEVAFPEVRIGVIPDAAASFFLPRLKNHFGYYLALTGARVNGYDNVRVGTATHYCESARMPELEQMLCTTDDVKETLDSFCNSKTEDSELITPYLERIDRFFSSQTVEEIISKLKEDGSPWAKNTIGMLRQMCPLALKATLYNLHLSKNLTLEQCLQNEYILANALFRDYNFLEGVRAHLKDKDNKPKWNPSKLEDISLQTIEHLYTTKRHLGPIQIHFYDQSAGERGAAKLNFEYAAIRSKDPILKKDAKKLFWPVIGRLDLPPKVSHLVESCIIGQPVHAC